MIFQVIFYKLFQCFQHLSNSLIVPSFSFSSMEILGMVLKVSYLSCMNSFHHCFQFQFLASRCFLSHHLFLDFRYQYAMVLLHLGVLFAFSVSSFCFLFESSSELIHFDHQQHAGALRTSCLWLGSRIFAL